MMHKIMFTETQEQPLNMLCELHVMAFVGGVKIWDNLQ